MNGLELIKHTAGGGVMTASGSGTVSLVKNGKIEFTNATEVHVDKCFDVPADPNDEPLYDNYLFVVSMHSLSTSSQVVYSKLRANGSQTSGSDYAFQYLATNNNAVNGGRTTSSQFARLLGASADAPGGAHIYFYGPNLQQPTAMRSVTVYGEQLARTYDWAATHSSSSTYDGLSLVPTQHTMTGSLTIYGFTKQSVV